MGTWSVVREHVRKGSTCVCVRRWICTQSQAGLLDHRYSNWSIYCWTIDTPIDTPIPGLATDSIAYKCVLFISINQSINQYLSASMPHGTRAQAGPKQHYNTNKPYIHTKKTVGLDNVSFTHIVYNSVYNSVKGLQSIGSSVWHYVPKRAFHIVWITDAVLWLWQARHGILAMVSSSEMKE